jgi:NADH-quinone oxidoreductase subunit G
MPKITIDDIELEVEPGLTVLQACELAGKEIPRFCFHERLSVAGNCRMCLVEMERAPKPIASCAMPVGEGMVIRTDTEMVKKAREGVMEFLLINHPLDCPICDQGGECDLQDQAMGYGYDRSRFGEKKRAVDDPNLGPLVKTIMTRCIHCTRCVRFATEIAGVPELGLTGRGENVEIGTYVEKALSSELSGNMIDLCPVGALTSKPYAFMARSWELSKTESIDVMDAIGTNIRIDARGPGVMRILPRNNDDVNEEWLSDKGRFANDGLARQRLDKPYVRAGGKLTPVSWDQAFAAIQDKLKGMDGSKIAALAGDLADTESMAALKDLMASLGSNNLDCRQDGAPIGEGARAGHLFNSTIAGIDEADAILIIGSNPRWEAPVLNARIRERYLQGGLAIGVIGEALELTYRYEHLGAGTDALDAVTDGSSSFAGVLKDASKPMIILAAGAVARPDGAAVLAAARSIAEASGAISDDWNGFNMLHSRAGRVGGIEVGFLPGENGLATDGILDGAASGSIEAVYLLGADEIDMSRLGDAFVIYQGHHGDAGAHRADVILPGAAYTEKNATYVNTEGRAQRAQLATFPPGDAREDWAIIRALSAVLGKTLPYDTLADLRENMTMANPVFGAIDDIVRADWGAFGEAGALSGDDFSSEIENYYMTDPISRASETMARCIAEILQGDAPRTGTDG